MSSNESDRSARRLDLYSRLLLGIVGAAITAILGIGQLRLANTQQKLAERQLSLEKELSAQQAELQTIAMVSEYLGLMGEPGETGQRAKKVIRAAAKHLSEKYDSQFLAKLADEILGGEDLQIREATEPAPAKPAWFAVLASFPENQRDSAINRARELAATLASQGATEHPIVVYKTQISRDYAVTVGGKLAKSEAIRLAARAREKGWAFDAFAQIDRNWSEEEKIAWPN